MVNSRGHYAYIIEKYQASEDRNAAYISAAAHIDCVFISAVGYNLGAHGGHKNDSERVTAINDELRARAGALDRVYAITQEQLAGGR